METEQIRKENQEEKDNTKNKKTAGIGCGGTACCCGRFAWCGWA